MTKRSCGRELTDVPKVTWEEAARARATLAEVLKWNDAAHSISLGGSAEDGYHLIVTTYQGWQTIPFAVDRVAVVTHVIERQEPEDDDN